MQFLENKDQAVSIQHLIYHRTVWDVVLIFSRKDVVVLFDFHLMNFQNISIRVVVCWIDLIPYRNIYS